MRNFTTEKGKALLWKLPLVLGCALAASVSAQTPEQVQAIQKQSNLEQLRAMKNTLAQKTPSAKVLRRQAKKKGVPFSGEVNGKLFQLDGFSEKTGLPIYLVTYNADAAAGTQTDKLYSEFGVFDLSGENMKVHEWDGGGVLTTHQEFGGRVTQKDVPTKISDHATHVAGTLIAAGVNANAKGMAYKATLDAYDWDGDEEEMISAAKNGALVSNHSYGYSGGFVYGNYYQGKRGWYWIGGEDDLVEKRFGAYLANDQQWDFIAYNAPYYLPVKAAGNSRGDGPNPGDEYYEIHFNPATQDYEWKATTKVRPKNGGEHGYDCIIQGTVPKNTLVVGAAKKLPNGYTNPSDVEMAPFSSFGPTDDGRIKPDITGVGVGLLSSWNTGNNQYNSISGTSMASPNVTGSLLLLQELYSKENANMFMKSSTLRALVAGTANEAYSVGPDYASGWGLLNAFKAASTISLNGTYSLIQENTLDNNDTQTINVVASGSEPLKVTIAWTDPASPVLSDENKLNDRTKMLVNDLDIRVTDGTDEYLPWVLNPESPGDPATKGDNVVDNIEQVVIENAVAGKTYTITVSHKGNLKEAEFQGGTYSLKDAASQDYGLVVTGVNDGVSKDLALKHIMIGVDRLDYTDNTPVKFTVENLGVDDVSDAKIHYTLVNTDTNTVVAEGDEVLGNVTVGATVEKEILIDLSQSFVNYEIKGEIVSAQDQVSLNNKAKQDAFGVVADLTKKGNSHFFGFEEGFEDYGWTSEDVNKDKSTWYKYNDPQLAYEGENFALNFPKNTTGINDWLFSNPIRMKANTLYRVTFYIRKFQDPKEELTLAVGNKANSSSMQLISNSKIEATGEYVKHLYEFTVPSDGVHYIGFNHKTEGNEESYAIALDNFTVRYSEGIPVVDFDVDNNNPTTYDVVSFVNGTESAPTQPILSYEWTITPTTFDYLEGTTASSKNPKVKFNKQGVYTVTLKATNIDGEDVESKVDFIKVENEEAKAKFSSNKKSIDKGGVIEFKNESTGKPAPNTFEWVITPSEGVEYVGGTSKYSKNPKVKFGNEGYYTVKLMATSVSNTDSEEKVEWIEVRDVYAPVRNLGYTFDENTSNLKLTWKRPNLYPVYEETFDGLAALPNDMISINNNADNHVWRVRDGFVYSYSWFFGAFDVDDWLITSEVERGAEILKYEDAYSYNERYDVYVVPVPTNGAAPTVDYIKNNGHKVHTVEGGVIHEEFKGVTVDIKEYTNTDFYIAYHHRTKAADDGLVLKLDNIYVGYKNGSSTPMSVNSRKNGGKLEVDVDTKELVLKGDVLIEYFKESTIADTYKEYGKIDVPRVTGYEVVKDGVLVDTKYDITERTYDEVINEKGTFTYDVYVVYSDGVKSEKKTIVVDLETMGTSDVDVKGGVQVYPNPSNGLFTVALESNVSSFETVVYDLTGKLLFKKSFQGNTAELNLTKYAKGVYVLNIVDNNGKQKTVKLVIK